MATTRGLSLVPGTKPSVGTGAGVADCAGVGDALAAGDDVGGSVAAEGEEIVEPQAASANEMRSGGRTSRVRPLCDESITKAPDRIATTSAAAAIIGVNMRFMTVSSPCSEWPANADHARASVVSAGMDGMH